MSENIGGAVLAGVSTHARQRMAERWGRDLAPHEWGMALDALRSGRAPVVSRGRGGVEVRAVPLGGLAVRMAWAPSQGVVVTVLPERGFVGNEGTDAALIAELELSRIAKSNRLGRGA